MYTSGGLPSDFSPSITFNVFPSLIKLFSDTSSYQFESTIQEHAVQVFSILVLDNDQFQKVAMDSDSILQLAEILNHGPKIIEEEYTCAMDYVGRRPRWEKTEEVLIKFTKRVLYMQ
jgi:hypothetical protein